ncbi:phosphate acyltransferase PlsX [Calderihabitans maritimus]|uniref:Phosphate acyltransferase n=1 Tax=Calderihabitans maritimus TaxID=1246530 RepID=A0A1Z5HNX2_9FIRM|nr:phosphate acyltransferase PlsX [Calderihabitans maritimus]GAW91077.1 phosphate acyltransferase [Calderihabitans maritimus]
MKIAVDAMGGDYAPEEIVKGAVQAAEENIAEIILVGDKEAIARHLPSNRAGSRIEIVHAAQVVDMDEPPAVALRRKKDTSIATATRLVKEGKADAVISAGSTGAQMAAAHIILGRIKGIQRPAIATVFPTRRGAKLILDVGANADCKPQHLVEFALMGSIYAEKILEISHPKVGLLNIGTEETKGNELTQTAYRLLKESSLNFAGNVEARDIPSGIVDVVVCDGFVGNVVLKFAEGLAGEMLELIKQHLAQSLITRLGAALAFPALKRIKKIMDYTEYGGAPLLGVEGVSIICHGSSKAKEIRNAIKGAARGVESRYVERIREFVAKGEGADA